MRLLFIFILLSFKLSSTAYATSPTEVKYYEPTGTDHSLSTFSDELDLSLGGTHYWLLPSWVSHAFNTGLSWLSSATKNVLKLIGQEKIMAVSQWIADFGIDWLAPAAIGYLFDAVATAYLGGEVTSLSGIALYSLASKIVTDFTMKHGAKKLSNAAIEKLNTVVRDMLQDMASSSASQTSTSNG